MDYKEKIIDLLNQINDIKILKIIYGFVLAGYKEERAGS